MKKQKKTYNFDMEDFYNKEIAPLVTEIKRKCFFNKMPLFISVGIKGDDDSTTYAMTETYKDKECVKYKNVLNDVSYCNEYPAVSTTNKHIAVCAGCEVVPKSMMKDHFIYDSAGFDDAVDVDD